ncbi:MAG TPA: TadE/TadG family type IV pilus assembly protein [Pirellulales bacterium]|jgi:Flp pilus assembly protein TadG|nr:TadE/TadG family type IV pilus assembly protein [Pirellulales bacterium]
MKCRRRTAACRRGTSVVEFAFCAPVVFLVLFAVIEFSRVTQLQQSVRQAAFDGARAGVALDAATADVTNAATATATAVGISNPTVTMAPNPLTYLSPTVSVTVSTTPASNGWFLRFFNASSVISSTITLDREVQSISAPGAGS